MIKCITYTYDHSMHIILLVGKKYFFKKMTKCLYRDMTHILPYNKTKEV